MRPGRATEVGVMQALRRLAEQGIVTSRLSGRSWLWTANHSHLAWPYIVGLVGLRAELVDRIGETIDSWDIRPQNAILFGSSVRPGEGNADSDIDLLLVWSDADDNVHSERQTDELRADIVAWSGNRSHVLSYSASEWETIVDANEPIADEGEERLDGEWVPTTLTL